MLVFLSVQFVAFPDKSDALLSKATIRPIIEASGSLGVDLYDAKCTPTYPNLTITEDRKYDWCSNVATADNPHPWISYSFPNKAMKLTGYAVRNGCCYAQCCCDPETGKFLDRHCCCELYSFSLQGSNDNHTWKVIHSVEKDDHFIDYCQFKTYEFPETESFKFVRFVLEEQIPHCLQCMQINQIEFYGHTIDTFSSFYVENEENEESVSIIGKVRKY